MPKVTKTLTITTIHDFGPIAGPVGSNYGFQHAVAQLPLGDRKQLVCIHMQCIDKNPVEPNLPDEVRQMVKGMQQAMPWIDKLSQVSAEASIALTGEEYDEMGRPRPGEKILVTFEYGEGVG